MTQRQDSPTDATLMLHEGSITLPDGFEDRTANLFVPANTESQPNLSIARDNLREDESLEQYVTRQIGLLKSRLAGHKVTERGVARLGRDSATLVGEQIEAHYKNGGRTVYQRQAAFLTAPQRALIFTASCVRPFDDGIEKLWRNWLASFTPHRPDEPPAGN